MLDLSNVNGEPDFKRIHRAGQRRVYLKVTEGSSFVDADYRRRRLAAHRAGIKTGGYHFSHSERHSPEVEARFFATKLGRLVPGRDLRPCLDYEVGRTDPEWAERFMHAVEVRTGVKPIIYSYPDFLRRCHFKKAPGALWLASYGRNDGKEHPFEIPAPWKRIAAHQYTSNGTVAGCRGRVDVSHVFNFAALEVPSKL